MIAPGIRGYLPEMDARLPFSADAAKKLLIDAGYPDGFDVRLACPNDRYVNDLEICQLVAANLVWVGIRIKLQAEPTVTYFPRALTREVSFLMLGWSPAGYVAHNLLFTMLAFPAGAQGQSKFGGYANQRADGFMLYKLVKIEKKKSDGAAPQNLWRKSAAGFNLEVQHCQPSWPFRSKV